MLTFFLLLLRGGRRDGTDEPEIDFRFGDRFPFTSEKCTRGSYRLCQIDFVSGRENWSPAEEKSKNTKDRGMYQSVKRFSGRDRQFIFSDRSFWEEWCPPRPPPRGTGRRRRDSTRWVGGTWYPDGIPENKKYGLRYRSLQFRWLWKISVNIIATGLGYACRGRMRGGVERLL